MKPKLFIGIDVGGTKISAAIVNENGDIVTRKKHPAPRTKNAKPIIAEITQLISELLTEHHCSLRRVSGIGIGIPGIVDSNTSKILITPNIKLTGIDLAGKLTKKLKIPVALGNDVNLGTLGEYWRGAGRNTNTIIGIFPGTGVGGGIIINGKIYDFQAGAAELGHMTMELNGPKCSCGNYGCLEALVGRWAIERDIRKAVKKGKKTIITKLTNNNLSIIKSKVLKRALKKKDSLTTAIMKKVAHTLGLACVSLRHILNPQMIIFGGGIIEACGDFLMPRIKKTVKADPFFKKAGITNCDIRSAQLGDDAVIIGAVALIKEKIK